MYMLRALLGINKVALFGRSAPDALLLKALCPHSLVGRGQMRQFQKLFSAFAGRSAPDTSVLKAMFHIFWSVGARCVISESYLAHSLVGRHQMLLV